MTQYRPVPPSNQMQLELPGCTDKGAETMAEARLWVGRNYDPWMWFMGQAREDSKTGYASANYLLNSMRRKFKVSVPNAFAPAFARIAMERDTSIKFKSNKSQVDGFTTAIL